MVLFANEGTGQVLAGAAITQLDLAGALRFAAEGEQAALALVRIEPGNTLYENQLGNMYALISLSMWRAGRLRESIPYGRKAMDTHGKGAEGFSYGLTNLAADMYMVASHQAQLGDFSGAAAAIAAANAFLSPTAFHQLGPSGRSLQALIDDLRASMAASIAFGHGDFAAAQRIVHAAVASFPSLSGYQFLLPDLYNLDASSAYFSGDFAAAEQAGRRALVAMQARLVRSDLGTERAVAQIEIWLSMALAREGKREEAVRTIGPAVTLYRGLMKRNHGDQWLPLEFAEALYAQSLSDPPHRAALLHEASGLVDQLIPSIARLHDTREWRARIEAAQRAGTSDRAE